MGFANGLYDLTDYDGNTENIKPEDVQALEESSNAALRAVKEINEDSNTIENGLRKSQYVALYHKMLVEDVTVGGLTTKKSDELELYVGSTSSLDLQKGLSALNEANYTKYDNASNPPTFGAPPDVLFRAEFKPVNSLSMHKVTGQINNQAFLEAALVKLNAPGGNSRALADDKNTYEIDRIMGEVVLVTPSGVPGQMLNSNGDVIQNQVITIRYQDNGGVARYANIDVGDLASIKVPHCAAKVNPVNNQAQGYIKVSESLIGNMVPQKAINITAPVRSSLMMAKSMPATFALTSGTEGDTDLLEEEEEEEKGGWTSSWAQETVAAWAASSSSSDEQMLKALSDVEQLVPTWASSSSGDESVEKAAWATSTSASGGFASSTSDDDADDLTAIISKIDRVSKPVSAAWAEDSESDD